MWVSGYPSCRREGCDRTRPLTLTRELWDAHDRVVVGAATCAHCQRRYAYTRLLTAQEAAAPQRHGFAIAVAPIDSKPKRRKAVTKTATEPATEPGTACVPQDASP